TGALDVFSTWVRETLGITAFGSGWFEFIANIMFFVPLGLLLTLLVRRPWVGVLLALALSACAELAQGLLPARTASVRDVLANVLGAAIGAAIAWAIIAARRRRSPAGQVSSHD
ncbi:MAG TPA: VanZ family protein, partial [Microbacterium sp.]|uniref:VanZ family protein n=1 Tax=Microbacterium sp. TaxID=51671 RepID=UPI002BCD9CEE